MDFLYIIVMIVVNLMKNSRNYGKNRKGDGSKDKDFIENHQRDNGKTSLRVQQVCTSYVKIF
ncbi:hypothetical protein CULT_1490005 [[Clostridium] ultunense Esp]|nr:hypothetical protein CULT_1490005 [[Clostridium] ultunense Esp]